jgi:hypothetical protein
MAAQQPADGFGLVGVVVPLGGARAAGVGLIQDHLEQQVGRIGQVAPAAIAGVQGAEVEATDGLVDAPREMVGGKSSLEIEGLGMVVVPEGREEAPAGRVVARCRGYDGHGGNSCG